MLSFPLAARDYHILFISSYHPSYSTYDDQIRGIRSAFADRGIILDEEFMDTKRLEREERISCFLPYLSEKLLKLPPYDLVITADDNAFFFMKDYGDKLFPRIPWVFLGLNDKEAGINEKENPLSTGVLEYVSFRETMELMVSQFPDAGKIVLICDGTPSGKADLSTFRRERENLPPVDYQLITLEENSFQEMESLLAGQAPETPILLISAFLDKTGKRLDFYESLEMIYASATGPVYHLWRHGIGQGILGGYVVDHKQQGIEAGRLAKLILEGTPPDDLPLIEKSPNKYLFDWKEMKRWRITRRELPEGSEITGDPMENRLVRIIAFLTLLALFLVLMLLVYHHLYLKLRSANTELSERQKPLQGPFPG